MIAHPPPPEDRFVVWADDAVEETARAYCEVTAQRAAERRAAEDWVGGEERWPRGYRVRDAVTGAICVVEVGIATQPVFVTLGTLEVPMPPATHVLWGGHTLCKDQRLRGVPRDWPHEQRWISLKDVADGAAVPHDGCEGCWLAAPTLVSEIKKIGADR